MCVLLMRVVVSCRVVLCCALCSAGGVPDRTSRCRLGEGWREAREHNFTGRIALQAIM